MNTIEKFFIGKLVRRISQTNFPTIVDGFVEGQTIKVKIGSTVRYIDILGVDTAAKQFRVENPDTLLTFWGQEYAPSNNDSKGCIWIYAYLLINAIID